MIDEARPEIVVIATPPVLHHAIALRRSPPALTSSASSRSR
jgi:hypothetical protein